MAVVETVVQKLEKCYKSIQAHISRGGTARSIRGENLAIRYDALRDDAIAQDAWADYCRAHELEFGHTAFDCFA